MSAFVFRPSIPADAQAITALCRQMLLIGETNPMFEPSHLHWKYWRPWPTWSGARSYVIARDNELLAHVAAIPVTFRRGGAAWTLLHPLDWAARSEIVGVGAMLLQRLSRVADGLLVVGGSSMTQRMLGPLGFRPLPPVRRYAVARGVEALNGLEVRATAAGEDVPALEDVFSPTLVATRSPALTELWRECPALATHSYRVVENGKDSGGFLLGLAPGQARVIDVWCASSSPADWARVLRAARFEAQRFPTAKEVVTLANTALEQQALSLAGFEECGQLPMFMQPRAPTHPLEGVGLRFQMLDGDAAFLHQGQAESWLNG